MFQSRFQDSLNCNHRIGIQTLNSDSGFSPVSRIHSIATKEAKPRRRKARVSVPFPGFTQLQHLRRNQEIRTQRSFSPVSRIHSIATITTHSKPETNAQCFSPVSRIHSIATSASAPNMFKWNRFSPVSRIHSIATFSGSDFPTSPAMFQSRFQDSLNCNP